MLKCVLGEIFWGHLEQNTHIHELELGVPRKKQVVETSKFRAI